MEISMPHFFCVCVKIGFENSLRSNLTLGARRPGFKCPVCLRDPGQVIQPLSDPVALCA